MHKNIFRYGSFLIFTLLCACSHQEALVAKKTVITKDAVPPPKPMDFSLEAGKIRRHWIQSQINNYLLELKKKPSLAKMKKADPFPLGEHKDHDAKTLLCNQHLIELREQAAKAYLNSIKTAIASDIDESELDIGKLLSDLVNDQSVSLTYEIPQKAKESCESNLHDFHKTASSLPKTPESVVTAVETEATLYGILKNIIIRLDQKPLDTHNTFELSRFLSESVSQKDVDDAIQAAKEKVIANSKTDKHYAIKQFKKAYLAMNKAAKSVKPLQVTECKNYFSSKNTETNSPDFLKCTAAVYAKIEDKINHTLNEANKYDVEANIDPTALITKIKTDFGNLKKIAYEDWNFSINADLVSSVIRAGRLANTLSDKLKSDEIKNSIEELAKELK